MQAQAGPGTYKYLINTRSFTHTLYVPLTLLNDIHRSILPIDVMYQRAAFKPLYHIQFSLPQLH